MPGDDLHQPLGFEPEGARKPVRPPLPWRRIGYSAAGFAIAGLAIAIRVTDNGMGGEPFAVAKIEMAPPSPAPVPLAPTADAGRGNAGDVTGSLRAPNGRMSGSEAELESGVKVVRQGGGSAPGALIIEVPPDTMGIHLPPAPDKRLVEKGRYGAVPRIGVDGARAAEVYSRPVVTGPGVKPGAPRIALVVGGMGLSLSATQNAASKLPGAVTLAFAPYGADLEKQVARTREQGHEVILQIPMEPFEMAQKPGPHTLTLAEAPEQNLDHLQWLLSRFTGYVGISGFLGAKFLANEAALAPVMRETAARGLLYFDDGGAGGATAASVGAAQGAIVLVTDVVLDSGGSAQSMDAELIKLETLARQKGFAVGSATGLPATVEQLARFTHGLEKRGITLVPLSSQAAFQPMPSAKVNR